jgi:hypothetical protein
MFCPKQSGAIRTRHLEKFSFKCRQMNEPEEEFSSRLQGFAKMALKTDLIFKITLPILFSTISNLELKKHCEGFPC